MARVFNLILSAAFNSTPAAYAAGVRCDRKIEDKSWMRKNFDQ